MTLKSPEQSAMKSTQKEKNMMETACERRYIRDT
jgi:hypothetical protein